ncbi:MAG: pantetheine-phosphate adenylyltransferase [Succinivibrionaceae bacterium]|nr:pantetheine-phosphate adenylyltransferase [Succinivibrionaceae bacterium]
MSIMKAVFPGSFDPLTYGHIDIIRRAATMFDHLVVAVAASPCKHPMLSLDVRASLAAQVLKDIKNVSVVSFDNLMIDFLREEQAHVLIRGLRSTVDFQYELNLIHMYRTQLPNIEVVCLPTKLEYSFMSSTLVREIAIHRGPITQYVPAEVAKAISDTLSSRT